MVHTFFFANFYCSERWKVLYHKIAFWIFLAYKVFWVWSYMRGKNFPPWLPGSEESQFLSIFACVHQHSGSRCLSWLGKVCRRISGSLNGTTALGWGVKNSRTKIKCQIIQKILSLIWPKTCFWHLLLLSKVTVSFRALLGEPSRRALAVHTGCIILKWTKLNCSEG